MPVLVLCCMCASLATISAALAAEPVKVGNIVAPDFRLDLVQEVKNGEDDPARMDGVSDVALCGDWLYVFSSNTGAVTAFKRDPDAGTLTFAGEWNISPVELKPVPMRDGRTLRQTLTNRMAFANGRMYCIQGFWEPYRPCASKGLAWFDLDPKTGQPVEKGRVDCPADKTLVASPDGKSLYLRSPSDSKILWFSLDKDGRPAKAGELEGKGLKGDPGDCDISRLTISPDGKNLYTIPDDYPDKKAEGVHAVAWVARKADGSLEYKGSFDLRPYHAPGIKHSSLYISPDGRHVYVGLAGYNANQNCRLVLDRNADTGELTLRDRAKCPPAPYQRLDHMCFDPSGRAAYAACIGDGVTLLPLTVDPDTGALSRFQYPLGPAKLPWSILTLDPGGKYLYAAQSGGKTLWVFKVVRKPGEVDPASPVKVDPKVKPVPDEAAARKLAWDWAAAGKRLAAAKEKLNRDLTPDDVKLRDDGKHWVVNWPFIPVIWIWKSDGRIDIAWDQ